jgi:hypothetical protein
MFDSVSIFSAPQFGHKHKFSPRIQPLRRRTRGSHRAERETDVKTARPGRAATLVQLLILVALAGCANAPLDNPFSRSLGWFNYLDASDIRSACTQRSGERYRLIYNAVWGEQVRIYDIAAAPADVEDSLAVRIFFPEDLNSIDLRDPFNLYRGHTGIVLLSAADMVAFREALRASGFDAPTPRGLTLPSDGFYWVVAACRDGVFHYSAYVYSSDRFAAIRFDRWLFDHDPTSIAVNLPGPSEPRSPSRNVRVHEGTSYTVFDMTVGDNGLVGVGALF